MMFSFINPAVLTMLTDHGADLIKAMLGAVIGLQYARTRLLKDHLKRSQEDIAFLLRAEALHCDLHRETIGESCKLRVRRQVEAEGLNYSGMFTPSRIRYRSMRAQFGRWAALRYLDRNERAGTTDAAREAP
jgi:hypothetical protein